MMELISRKLVMLDTMMAESMLKINTYAAQRVIRDKHVRDLMKIIQDDLFITGEIATANFTFNGGQTVLMNGQHQCHAVIKTGVTVPVVYEQFRCDSLEDASLLYRQFDNHAQRSLSNVLKPEALALGIFWAHKVINVVVTGAVLIENAESTDKTIKIPLLSKYIKQGSFVNDIMCNRTDETRHMFRGPVVAAMMMTYDKNHAAAYEFWTAVKTGENLNRSDPAYKLREYLKRSGIMRSMVSVDQTNNVSRKEMVAKCITAWNAFRRKETTNLGYYANKPVPKAI